MRKTIFLILVIPILIFYSFGITYAYVITNTQTFNMSEPEIITQSMLGNQGSYYIHEYERENLMFPGAPSSLMLGGNKWVLSGVEFDMSYNLSIKVEAYSKDGWFSSCSTCGQFEVWYRQGPASDTLGFLPPIFLYDSKNQVGYSDTVGPVFCETYSKYEKIWEVANLKMLFSPDSFDLSVFEVEEFIVQLERDLHMGIYKWNKNDINNWMKYGTQWNGSLTSKYYYSQVPIPGTVWLLASGLIGLMGIRRKLRKN